MDQPPAEIFQDDDPDDTAFQAWRQSMWDLANAMVAADRLHAAHGGDRDGLPRGVRHALQRLDKTPNPYESEDQ